MKLIALVDAKGGIGKDGQQVVYIPGDLRRFKERTVGHTIVVGRKTLATFTNGQPLPERRNIVLSRNKDLEIPGAEVCHDVNELMALIDATANREDVFVVGGAETYKALFPYCDTAYITQLYTDLHADTRLPEYGVIKKNWRLAETSKELFYGGFLYQYQTWCR